MEKNFLKLVHIIILHKNNILLMRRKNTLVYSSYYSLPSGKCKDNESLIEAAQRESNEEIGITFQKSDISLISKPVVYIDHINKENYINFFFTINKFSGKILNREPNLCDELSFFSLKNLPTPMIPFVKTYLQELQLLTSKISKTKTYNITL